MSSRLEINIVQEDIASVDADVVALKYAQAFYGADAWMASKLGALGVAANRLQPEVGQHVLMETRGSILARYVLFIGVPSLRGFRYNDIYEFSGKALTVLKQEQPGIRHIALTIHGVGFGMDELESFLSELVGLIETWSSGLAPAGLQTITIVERNAGRVARLKQALAKYVERSPASASMEGTTGGAVFLRSGETKKEPYAPLSSASYNDRAADTKGHVFVAMPYTDTLEDVFYFGVQNPVHQAGLLCERMDHTAFTGDIVTQMKLRIETASVVIAVLTGANPNVYLEVGYAWGKGVPVILVVSKVEDLAFDVKGNRCLTYSSIRHLEEQLGKELSALQASGELGHR
jgi:hypothetical protein